MKYRQIIRPGSENEIQAGFFRWCEMQAGKHPELRLAFSIPNGTYKGYASSYLHKATGLKAGVPDVLLPVARGRWHGFFIEFKSEKGRVRDEQKSWMADLEAEGYLCRVLRDHQAAAEMVLAYLKGEHDEI